MADVLEDLKDLLHDASSSIQTIHLLLRIMQKALLMLKEETSMRASRFYTTIPFLQLVAKGTLALVCAVTMMCCLPSCVQKQETTPAQNNEAASSQEETDSQDKADESSAKEQDKTSKDADKEKSKPAVNEALAQKWNEDLTRIAQESGMDVCVSAVDLTSGAKATYQSDKKMLSASMIKLLIAETFLRQVSEGAHALDDVYVLKDSDIVGGAGSLGYRGAGAEVAYREVLKLMIAESDNTAANILIDACGMDAINAESKRLKLKCTELGRHMMDTQAAANGYDNYTCADDLAKLLRKVYNKTFVNEEMSALMLECLEAQTDNDCISTGLPAGTVFAHKTGSLANVRHDGGIVEGDKPFVIVVLCGGDGFSESAALRVMGQMGEVAYKDMQES